MSNAILNVKEVPNEKRRAAFERLKSYSGVLRENIDYEKEKMEWLDEKYACVD